MASSDVVITIKATDMEEVRQIIREAERRANAAVADERERITRVAEVNEPDADEAFDFVNGREAWEAGWLAGRAAVLAIVAATAANVPDPAEREATHE
jgi:hypothetical protein